VRFVLGIIVLAIVVNLLGCGTDPEQSFTATQTVQQIDVELALVTRTDLTTSLELVGNFLPSRRSVIVAEVDGVIEKIPRPTVNPTVVEFAGVRETLPLDIGTEVKKGELLVKLDASEYELGLETEKAQLAHAKTELANLIAWKRPEEITLAKALHDEAIANLERAESDYDRVIRLVQDNAVSASEHDEKQANALKARALLAHAKANVAIAEAGPTAEQLAVGRAALASAEAQVKHERWKVDKTSVVAPYDAVVTDRYVDVGDRVTALPRVEIMEVMDIRFLVAEVGVPERYFGSVQLLERAAIRVQGHRDPIPGLIVRINDKVDPGSRAYRIRVAIDNTSRQFHVGQFVRVVLNIASSPNTLTVPRRAVSYSGGQPNVFVFANGKVTRHPVELGIETDDSVEIVSGLNEKAQIVVDDPAVLTDNMPVQVRKSKSIAQVPVSKL
jgi:multidrug resistance efflux pump